VMRDPWIPVYRRYPVRFVRGEGMWLYDTEGRAYLDFLAGIGASSLGHNHPLLRRRLSEALSLLHVSNFFSHPAGEELAERLSELAGGRRVFFSNSGTEANEAALKLCRKYGGRQGRAVILSATDAFHGRTLGSLAMTPHPPYQDPFRPLPEGFAVVRYGDLEDLAAALDRHRPCAVFLEPIQGEAGVVVPPAGYLRQAKELVHQAGALLVVDDVQTGMGRTGYYFAEQHEEGMLGDVITLAKGLGGGVPIGATLAVEAVAEAIAPGEHGTTFGGNPLAAAAGLAVTDWLADGGLEHVRQMAEPMQSRLQALAARHPEWVEGVRGRGLMWALVLKGPAAPVVERALAMGLVANATHGNVVRLLPPLIVETAHLDRMAELLDQALAEVRPPAE
jgi:acetylornithine/N-succinyldiaminopimelate aminotransferase